MKYLFTICLVIFSAIAFAQKKLTYYDYNWKPADPLTARFYSAIDKTDSGWLRYDYFISGPKLQMRALYEDSACKIHNGLTVFYYANGQLESIGRKVHGKKEGVCVSYHSNGMIADSATYHNDIPVGNDYSWYRNGMIKDSAAHVNDSMDVEVTWYDDGTPSSAGYLLSDKMHGKWQFFHPNGKIAGIELYDHGKLTTCQFFNEDGSPQPDTTKASSDAVFRTGPGDWQNYLSKNLYWPEQYQFSKGDMAVVVVDITIDENGKPENVEVVTPFHPAFDKIALNIIKSSPAWKPRISHNRRVKARFRQPVTFHQEEEQ